MYFLLVYSKSYLFREMSIDNYKKGSKTLVFALQSLEGHQLRVELRNEEVLEGTLETLDSSLK